VAFEQHGAEIQLGGKKKPSLYTYYGGYIVFFAGTRKVGVSGGAKIDPSSETLKTYRVSLMPNSLAK
jgi:hypothetical protein